MNIEALLEAQRERIGKAILKLNAKYVALLYNADTDEFKGLDEAAARRFKFRKMPEMTFPTPPELGALRTMWVLIVFNERADFRWVRMHVHPEPGKA